MWNILKYIFLSVAIILTSLLAINVIKNGNPWENVSDNLLNPETFSWTGANGITCEINNDEITLNGTYNGETDFALTIYSKNPGIQYKNSFNLLAETISGNATITSGGIAGAYIQAFSQDLKSTIIANEKGFNGKLTYNTGSPVYLIRLYARKGITFNNLTFRICANTDSLFIEYNKYTGKFKPSYKNGIISTSINYIQKLGEIAENYMPNVLEDFQEFTNEFANVIKPETSIFLQIWKGISFIYKVLFYPLELLFNIIYGVLKIAIETFTIIITF